MGKMLRWFPAVVVACALGASCAGTDNASATPTQPSSFASPTTVETFTGTVAVAGTDSHPFNVPAPGEVDVTLTSLTPAPDPMVPLTLAIGLPSSTVVGQCASIQSVSTTPGTAPQITGHALAGTFCVSVTDTNSVLTASETYTVVVAHP